MVDASNQPVSTRVGPIQVTVLAGGTTPQAISFPATSFISTPGAANGNLIVYWDIAGQQDPSACNSHNVDSIHFRLRNLSGALVGTDFAQACNKFSASTPAQYPAASYTFSGEFYLGSTVRTTSITVPITIMTGGTMRQDLSFPDNSFL